MVSSVFLTISHHTDYEPVHRCSPLLLNTGGVRKVLRERASDRDRGRATADGACESASAQALSEYAKVDGRAI